MMLNQPVKENFKAKGKAFYKQINEMSGGGLKILTRAVKRFVEARAAEAAAAITYYALFSLFPLLLFLVAVASYVLRSPAIQAQIMFTIGEVFPTSRNLVQENIRTILDSRGAVGIVGTVGLLWAATAVFSVLTQNINRAWQRAAPRNFLKLRLMALIIVASMVALLILSLIFTTATNILSQFDISLWGSQLLYDTVGWNILSSQLPMLFIFIAFFFLYWWAPNTKVRWQEASLGAIFATIGWGIVKSLFTWYLSSGLARHQLIYGSLGAVVALMLWMYLSNVIILFGAHISAAIGYYHRNKEQPDQE